MATAIILSENEFLSLSEYFDQRYEQVENLRQELETLREKNQQLQQRCDRLTDLAKTGAAVRRLMRQLESETGP